MSGMMGSEVSYGAPSDDGGRVNHGPEGEAGRGYGSSYGGRGGYGGRGNTGGRDRRPEGGGRGGGQRDGDWVCPNTSCGNVNFARRVECNKCGTGKASSGTQPVGQNSGYGGGGNWGNRSSGFGGGDGYGAQSGSGGYRQGNNYGNQGIPGGHGSADDYEIQAAAGGGGGAGGGYGYGSGGSQVPGNTLQAGNFYGGQAAPSRGDYGSHTHGDSRGSRGDYGGDSRRSRGGDYGGGRTHGDSRGQGGYDSHGSEKRSSYSDTQGDTGGDDVRSGSQYGGSSEAVKVKQCDSNCGQTCDNARIYISGLPSDVTVEELRDLFGGIGQVARIKQKRGYKDQWPWNIKLYVDNAGQNKGDGVLSYEDPSAAHSAGGFFNDHVLRGHQIKVTMAEKSAPRPSGGGGYGQGHGGDRGGGYGGPDRRFGGGHRSRPY